MQVTQVAQKTSERASEPFVGQWNHLVSTTNWEKGRIIHQWREAMIHAGAPATEYSDDAWSRRVGSLSGQHAGRLRRVYDRFHTLREEFPGLYWSHFQAALDWADAEMWLEGAVQDAWSVNQMRQRRAEALGGEPGGPTGDTGDTGDDSAGEVDDDALTAQEARPQRALPAQVESVYESASPAGPDFGDDADVPPETSLFGGDDTAQPGEPARETVPPFEDIGQLPPDVEEALESFKVAILRHKSAGWIEVTPAQILTALEGLRTLACSV
jgi:hypothetical protein